MYGRSATPRLETLELVGRNDGWLAGVDFSLGTVPDRPGPSSLRPNKPQLTLITLTPLTFSFFILPGTLIKREGGKCSGDRYVVETRQH